MPCTEVMPAKSPRAYHCRGLRAADCGWLVESVREGNSDTRSYSNGSSALPVMSAMRFHQSKSPGARPGLFRSGKRSGLFELVDQRRAEHMEGVIGLLRKAAGGKRIAFAAVDIEIFGFRRPIAAEHRLDAGA